LKKFVVDASVAIKWLIPEVHSVAAARLLDPEMVLAAPDLIGPEVANTIWKKLRRREIKENEAREIVAAFERLALEIYPSAALLPAALELAVGLHRSVYDSIYLALAIAQSCPLITADHKFRSVVIASPFGTHIGWVEDEL
jgi:predicted nucleic acid-binding protein